jgi:hypothetical protein
MASANKVSEFFTTMIVFVKEFPANLDENVVINPLDDCVKILL